MEELQLLKLTFILSQLAYWLYFRPCTQHWSENVWKMLRGNV